MIEINGYNVGTLAQVVTAVAGTGLLGALLPFALGYRKVSLDAEGLLRTHFSETLKDLQAKLDVADERIEQAAARQRDCEKREEKLRHRVRELEDHLEGVYRMLVQTNAEKVIQMGDNFPAHIVDLARRTQAYSEALAKPHKGDKE
jgi:chromosome segregation ATPase